MSQRDTHPGALEPYHAALRKYGQRVSDATAQRIIGQHALGLITDREMDMRLCVESLKTEIEPTQAGLINVGIDTQARVAVKRPMCV